MRFIADTPDTMLAEYSKLAGRIACLEHALHEVGGLLTTLGQGLTSKPVAVAPAREQRFQLNSNDYLSIRDVEVALRQLEDLIAVRKRADALARTLAQTEHAHMVADRP